MAEKTINRIVAGAVFLATFAVYMRTLSTTVVFWDVGEFCAASRLLEIPHPPGSPFFTLLARIASLIPFRDDIAARMHAVSALGSALGIMFLYLVGVKLVRSVRGEIDTAFDRVIVYGSSAIGALTLAFSTTYWDNSIEAEVYGLGMFFASACLWLALRWREEADEPRNERYILMIAYLLGLASGVHILALLVTIPVLMIVYFRLYEFSPKSFLKFSLIALAIFFVIYPGLIQILPGMLDGEIAGVNNVLIPFIPPAVIVAAAYGAYRSYREKKKMLHLACLAFLLIFLGYATYTQVLIRANVPNLPMNENNPNNLSRLTAYLTREQYGETPMLKGRSWNNETQSYEEKLFPRRWSTEPMHEPTRANYTSDGDFFWRYQVNHMFIRYILWNFIGSEGDWQDAGVSWKETWGIPFFLSLLGLAYVFRKDWKTGLWLAVMFIIMGIVLDLYQNQQDPQPRERDYFYVGAYYVMCLWIVFGIVGLIDGARRYLRAPLVWKSASGVVLAAALAVVPLNLARVNWNSHDRSQLYIAWDYSYNLLQSVAPNAILFTNGDNDTFPLWYLQDVEGIRRDVRIVNLSLVNTTWYVHQVKDAMPWGTKKVALSLSDQQIDQLQPVEWAPRPVSVPVPKEVAERYGSTDTAILNSGRLTWQLYGIAYRQDMRVLRIQDIVVRDIIVSNHWERPLFFAATVSPDSKIGLDNYLWMEGLALELKPMRAFSPSAALDIPKMERNFLAPDVVPSKEYQPGLLFRNLNKPGIYYDDNAVRMMFNYRIGFLRIADYYMRRPGNSAQALRAISQMENRIPIGLIPMLDWSYTFAIAKMFNDLGDTAYSTRYGNALESKCEELIRTNAPEMGDISKNPYLYLSELYGLRKDYAKAIDMLDALSVLFPNTPWISTQIAQYNTMREGGGVKDTSKGH